MLFTTPEKSPQTAASIITNLIDSQQYVSLVGGWIVPILMLPIFGLYLWIRGVRGRGETAVG
ncbi:MAG: hypothetical protein HGA65_17425 [Oscillochloris sp.]|nr:hypothetical protein [Oscillochloris sp.]